jgi:thioredoxin 1
VSTIATSSSTAATSRSTTSLLLSLLFSHGDFAIASNERFAAPPTAAAARRRRHNHLTTFASSSSSSSSSSTALQMVAKSGGKQILSTEQFEMEVLGINADSRSSSGRTTNSSDDPEEPNDTTSLVQQQTTILVLFTAPWCGPCRLTIPIVREIQNLYPPTQLSVYEISTDDLPEVAELAGVSSIPTIVLYYGGEVHDTIVGCVNVKVLSRAVEKVMEDVGMIK